MDPNAALEACRQAVAVMQDETADDGDRLDAGDRLAEHFAALDEWLSRGGFAPDAWAAEPADGEYGESAAKEDARNAWQGE